MGVENFKDWDKSRPTNDADSLSQAKVDITDPNLLQQKKQEEKQEAVPVKDELNDLKEQVVSSEKKDQDASSETLAQPNDQVQKVIDYLNNIKDQDWRKTLWDHGLMMDIQRVLVGLGYADAKIQRTGRNFIDGYWWPATRAAVAKFQESKQLSGSVRNWSYDGVPGPETLTAVIQTLSEQKSDFSLPTAELKRPSKSRVQKKPKTETPEGTATEIPAKGWEKLPQIKLSDLGEWQNNKFIFKQGVEKTDQKGKYIEIGGQRYDQWKEGLTWLGYEVDINSHDEGRFYLWAYVNGLSTGKGKVVWSDGDVYEWDWKDDERTGKGKYILAAGITSEWVFEKGTFKSGKKTYHDDKPAIEGKFDANQGLIKEEVEEQEDQATETTYTGQVNATNKQKHGSGRTTFKDSQTEGGYYENGKLLFWGKKTGKDLSQQRGTVKLTEKYEANTQKQRSQVRTVESWWTAITLRDDASGYHFSTKSGDKLTLPKSLWRQKALAAANLINAAVGIVKNSRFQLDYFEADGDILQADYKKYVWDTDLIQNVQGKFWVSATVLADWMNKYRKDVGI